MRPSRCDLNSASAGQGAGDAPGTGARGGGAGSEAAVACLLELCADPSGRHASYAPPGPARTCSAALLLAAGADPVHDGDWLGSLKQERQAGPPLCLCGLSRGKSAGRAETPPQQSSRRSLRPSPPPPSLPD